MAKSPFSKRDDQYELSRRSDSNFFGFIYVLGQSGAHVGEKGTVLFDALTDPANDRNLGSAS